MSTRHEIDEYGRHWELLQHVSCSGKCIENFLRGGLPPIGERGNVPFLRLAGYGKRYVVSREHAEWVHSSRAATRIDQVIVVWEENAGDRVLAQIQMNQKL